MDIRFDGKTVVVTGGSTGIGATTVKAFLNSGAKVVFTGIESAEDVDLSHCTGFEGLADYYRLDVTNEAAVIAFADYVQEKHDGCDILYNNAGILAPHILHETPSEEWLKTMNVNVNGVFYTSKYFIPQMIKKGGGAIVNTSSISGLFADHTFCSYNASKGAIANMTRVRSEPPCTTTLPI
jgi:meso-butanediol dehydrogenase/(S,S)-butanediol dehydrogenase/diacetyl reductase